MNIFVLPLDDSKAQAFNEGFLDYQRGDYSNPYSESDPEYLHYNLGYEAAEYQDEIEPPSHHDAFYCSAEYWEASGDGEL